MIKLNLSNATVFILLLLASCGGGEKTDTPQLPAPMFTPPASQPAFSGDAAMQFILNQVAFGPRVPGTPAHLQCRDYFVEHFQALGWETSLQSFSMPGYEGVTLDLNNVIARHRPEVQPRVLLCAHWDSRPFSDMETDETLKTLGVPGANDGASGVAVLMHLAEVLSATPPWIGVDIVLFDGEDYGKDGEESMFCLGSKYYAASLGDERPPAFGVLLDLVGDKEAVFPREGFSEQYAKDILDLFWSQAAALGLRQFVNTRHTPILDDHLPLNTTGGIKTINIIDASLVGHADANERRKYWHTQKDTPEQCSPATLGAVGTLLLRVLFGLQPSS
jgi:glutaminyl-peptide cyclotransferase